MMKIHSICILFSLFSLASCSTMADKPLKTNMNEHTNEHSINSSNQTNMQGSLSQKTHTIQYPKRSRQINKTTPKNLAKKTLASFSVKTGIYAQSYLKSIPDEGNMITVKVNQQAEQVLERMENMLYSQYSRYYVIHNDYNRDGYSDLAVLSSLDVGASNPCYRKYHYQPSTMKFVKHTGALMCNP